MNKKMLLLIVLILVLALGCPARRPSNTAKPADTNVVEGSVTEGDITLPTSGSMDKDVEEVDRGEFTESPADTTTTTTTTTTPPPEVVSGEGSNSNTYRVQVIASSTRSGADEAAGKLRSTVSNEKVFVDYVGGLYKVRVGGYSDYSGASALRDRLISQGYPDAWIVKAGVQ